MFPALNAMKIENIEAVDVFAKGLIDLCLQPLVIFPGKQNIGLTVVS